MGQTVNVEGVDVEIESRFRIEIGQWQASLRHPVHGFTVSEWGKTAAEAARSAYQAVLFYAGEMERFLPARSNV